MSRAHLEEAAEHAKKGRWAKAIDAYRAVLAEDPDNVELRVALAEAYKRAKNDERAFHHYHRAALMLLTKGDTARGAAALIEANAITPGVPDVLWRLCEALKALGRNEEFVASLVALIRSAGAPGDRRRLWALEELYLLHPDDLSVAQQRAEALFEADRIDDAVLAYKKLAARLHQREAELVQVLFRAAKIAAGRPDLGADLASVLLAHGRAKDALAVIVGFYEKAPDDVAVLETLVRTLEALGAHEKAVAARVELVKARAAGGSRAHVVAEVEGLLAAAPDEPVALEVAAHALNIVRESSRALEVWRRLLRAADRRGLKAERDRALAAVLKANADDEEALELGVQVHAQAGRFSESDALRQRLAAVRALKKRALVPAPAPLASAKRVSSPPLGSAGLPEEPDPEGTQMLSDADVLAVRGSDRSSDRDDRPERTDATPRPEFEELPRPQGPARDEASDGWVETTRPPRLPPPAFAVSATSSSLTPPSVAAPRADRETTPRADRETTPRPTRSEPGRTPPKAKPSSSSSLDPFSTPLPSNPWFDGRERRSPSALAAARQSSATAERSPRTFEVASGLRERRTAYADPASRGYGEETSGGADLSATRTSETPLPRRDDSATLSGNVPRPQLTASTRAHGEGLDRDEATWEADEPTTMDTRAVEQLRVLTDAVAVSELGPTLPGELTHPGFATLPAVLPDIVDDLADEP